MLTFFSNESSIQYTQECECRIYKGKESLIKKYFLVDSTGP